MVFILANLLFTSTFFSQNTCSVNYKVLAAGGTFENNEDVKKFKSSQRYIGIDEAIRNINYELLIKNDESFFRLKPALNINDKIAKTARNLVGTRSFYKKNKDIVHIITISNETFNVSFSENKPWILINESKIINNYLCFKATKEKLQRNKTSVEVIAWYCPEIPISNGPKEFGNLPGLILEVQDGRFVFFANQINLTKNQEFDINKIKGKILKEEEYNKILDDIIVQARNEMLNYKK